MEKKLLTVEETAEFLRMSPQTIYNQIHRRAKKKFPIPCKRVGRKVLFVAADVEAYLGL